MWVEVLAPPHDALAPDPEQPAVPVLVGLAVTPPPLGSAGGHPPLGILGGQDVEVVEVQLGHPSAGVGEASLHGGDALEACGVPGGGERGIHGDGRVEQSEPAVHIVARAESVEELLDDLS